LSLGLESGNSIYSTTDQSSDYPLRDSFILDSGATTHVNNRHRFLNFRPAEAGENLITANSTVSILGYGDVDIFAEPIDSGQKIQIRLQNVAYIPTFYTSLMSYDRAMAKSIYWDGQNGTLITNGYSFCKVMRRHGQC
jgi:hypothetical protein